MKWTWPLVWRTTMNSRVGDQVRVYLEALANVRTQRESELEALRAENARLLQLQRIAHEEQLEAKEAKVGELLTKIRAYDLEFQRLRGQGRVWDEHYELRIRFNPSFITRGMGLDKDSLEVLARQVGRQVEDEIATSKFIQRARQ